MDMKEVERMERFLRVSYGRMSRYYKTFMAMKERIIELEEKPKRKK